MPSEQNTYFGGNIINLINSFCFIFLPEILICLTMQWEMSHLNENTKKSKLRCYFSFFCGAMYFSSFCCLNERQIVVIIFHHQQPIDSLNHRVCHRWIFAASIFFHVQWWCLYAISLCSHSQICAAWRRMLSPASADRADKKLVGMTRGKLRSCLLCISLR